jgi:hypothetical protein
MGAVWRLVLFERCRYGCELPMAATVTAAAVSASTTVEAAAACYTTAAPNRAAANRDMSSAASEAATHRAACDGAVTVPPVSGPETASAPTRASPARASAPAAMEPRAGADKDAAREVARTVVTVRRAGVRVVPIVAVSADGSRSNIPRSDAHDNALGASVRCESQSSSKYRKDHQIFHEVFHIWAPSEPVKRLCL